MTNDDNEYYEAEHKPTKVWWRFVNRRKVEDSDRGPIVMRTEDIELLDKDFGVKWVNRAKDFPKRYKMTGKAREAFKKRFPDVEID